MIRAVDEALCADPAFGGSIPEPIAILGLDEFADSAVIIKARTRTKPIKQWEIRRELNRGLKRAFDRRGIETPFPHVTLYMGQDKTRVAPALRVRSERAEGRPFPVAGARSGRSRPATRVGR